MVQPMNVGSVIWASVIVILLLFVLELLQRPPVVAPKRAATAQPTAKGTGSAKSAGPTKRPASARK
jgi:hypothetical protein